MANVVTQAQLIEAADPKKPKTIGDYCENNFISVDGQNHCAHWVSHMYGFHTGVCCSEMGTKQVDHGVTIKVSDVYNFLGRRGPYTADKVQDGHLIFGISPKFMQTTANGDTIMQVTNHRHVGIIWNKVVYNYHNIYTHPGAGHVWTLPSVDAFVDYLRGHYHDPTVAAYYAVPQ